MVTYAAERFAWLQRQMSCGWRIEAPVIQRAAYFASSGRVCAFEFVLRGDGGMQVVAVPDCDELRNFLDERELDTIVL